MMSLESSSLSGLPLDLVEEILSRVSASSLKRLRSTCKQWNVLLSDQRFTMKHFEKAEKQSLVAMWRNFTVCLMRFNLLGLNDNIDPSTEVKCEDSLIDDPCFNFKTVGVFVDEVFHCSGLLLSKMLISSKLVVWNPCMGQTKCIETISDGDGEDRYALGYENNKSCYNYKILKFSDLETFELEIYDFNSNSWRVLGSLTPDFTFNAIGVSIKGNTYWIASQKEEEEDREQIDDFLISFDFTTEEFGPRVCLPSKDRSSWYTMSLSCVREERLSVLLQNDDTSEMEVWMTNDITQTKAMSWSPFLKIGLNTHRFGTEVTFFIDEKNKLMVCCDEDEDDVMNNFVHIIREDQYWRKVDIGLNKPRFQRIFTYVPSLLQIVNQDQPQL